MKKSFKVHLPELSANRMGGKFVAVFIGAGALASSGSLAMTKIEKASFGNCTVVGGEILPAASGGSNALCSAIERAVKAQAPTAHYSVKVRVISSSRLSAVIVVNGIELPEQRFAVMDRDLTPASMDHFAQSLALVASEAAKR